MGNEQCARVGGLGTLPKTEPPGLGFQVIMTQFSVGLGLQRHPVKSQEPLQWLSRWWGAGSELV